MIIAHTASSAKKNTGRYRILGNRIGNNNMENKATTGTLASNIPSGMGILLTCH